MKHRTEKRNPDLLDHQVVLLLVDQGTFLAVHREALEVLAEVMGVVIWVAPVVVAVLLEVVADKFTSQTYVPFL